MRSVSVRVWLVSAAEIWLVSADGVWLESVAEVCLVSAAGVWLVSAAAPQVRRYMSSRDSCAVWQIFQMFISKLPQKSTKNLPKF